MIKNLLFDLGGVIMDLRREDCVSAFRQLGMANPEEFLGEYSQKGPFGALEEGMISPAEFRSSLRDFLPDGVSDAAIDAAFCKFLAGIPIGRLRELEALRKRYKIYLVSNTNAIMWDTAIAEEFRKDGHDIDYYFNGILTSFSARSLKPSPEIFGEVVRRFGINPGETLFFDDSAANAEAAARLGFRSVVVGPGAEFADLLKAVETSASTENSND